MISRGEEQDGKKLMYRKRRQTVLLSATVTDDVIKLADLSLSDPARILIGEGKYIPGARTKM